MAQQRGGSKTRPSRPVLARREPGGCPLVWKRRAESLNSLCTGMAKVFLIHWEPEVAQDWAERLMAAGFTVGVESQDASRAYRTIRELEPHVVVANLDHDADRIHTAVESVRGTSWGREIPFIFVGGDEDSWFTLREQIPDATFVEEPELPAALDALRLDG